MGTCCNLPCIISRMYGTARNGLLTMAHSPASDRASTPCPEGVQGAESKRSELPGVSSGKRKMAAKQYKNHPRKMLKSNYEARFGETDYYFDEGFRRVRPYVYAFETFAKGRWYGMKLLDMFKKEFRLETPEFYAKAIETGLIKVNGERTTADYVVKNNDFMHSRVHRHEPPVTSGPIEILEQTEEFVVVNKPASMPVHPCGKYRHNTVVFLLAKEHNLTHLHTIHRLDRLTSGLLIFARTKAASQRIDALVRGRKLQKTYLCRVSGEFPSGTIECNEPILIVSHKIGVCRVRPDGKPCKTTFERVSYNGKTSIVKCSPETGRMHQIRVHLQYLGHPIENDPLYNNPVWGPERGHRGCQNLTDDQLLQRLVAQHDEERVTKINEYLDKNNIETPATEGLKQKSDGIEDHTSLPDNNPASACNDANIFESTAPETVQSAEGGEPEGTGAAVEKSGVAEVDNPGDNSVGIKAKSDEDIDHSKNESASGRIAESDAMNIDESCHGGSEVTSNVSPLATDTSRLSDETDTTDIRDRARTQEGTSKPHEKDVTASIGINNGQKKTRTVSGMTEMDGTLSGIGVLEVDEGELQELAREGSEASVDKIARMLCRECVTHLPDPKPEEMMIYLHALTYKGPDFEFSTPLPQWAVDHMGESTPTKD